MYKRRIVFSLVYLILGIYAVFIRPLIFEVDSISLYYLILLPIIPLSFFFLSIFKLKVPVIYEIIMLIFILMGVGVGSLLNYYDIILNYDMFLHTIAGFILSFIPLYYILLYKITIPKWLIFLIIFFVSMGFSAIWEMYEYGVDVLFDLDSQRSKNEGVVDTMHDIYVHSFGTLFLIIILAVDQKVFKGKVMMLINKHMFVYDKHFIEKNNTI